MYYKVVVGFILSILSLSSSAIDLTNMSVGADFGNVKYDSDEDNEDERINDKKSSFSLVGQYALDSNFDIELSLSNFGKFSFDTHSTALSALTASLVAKTNVINGFQPYIKAGYGFMVMTQTIDLLGSELENKTTGDTLLAGVGVGYTSEYLPDFTFSVSYDYYYFQTEKLISDEEYNNSLSGLSFGVMYHFN